MIDTSKWEKVAFGNIARCLTTAIKDPLSEGLDRYVGLEHIEPGNIHIKKWGNVAEGTTFTRVFRKGQVLFCKRRAYLRKAALAEFDGVCSGDILVCEAIEGALIPELLPFIVQSDRFFEFAIKTSAGSLSPRTKFKDLAKFTLRLPSKLDDQKRIADLLRSAAEVVDKSYEMISSYNEFTSVKLKSLLLGCGMYKKSDFKYIPRIGHIPEAWEVVKLSSVFDRIVQKNINLESDNVLTISAKQGLVDQEEYFTRNIASKNLRGYYLLSKGDFVYNKSYSEGFPAGVIKVLDKFEEGVVSPLYICFRSKEVNNYNLYFKYLFNTGFLNTQILSVAKEGARNHGLLNVTSSDFLELRIPLPSKDFISKVLEEIDLILSKTKIADEYHAASKSLNRSLLNQIFYYDL